MRPLPDASVVYQFRHKLTPRERSTLWLLVGVTIVVGVIFSVFFALGLGLERTDVRLYTSVTLVLVFGYWLFANLLVMKHVATFTLFTHTLHLRYPVGLPWRKRTWPVNHLHAVGLVIGERGVAELGLFGKRDGQFSFHRLYLPDDATAPLRQWAARSGLQCFTERAEYVAFLNRVGLEHDFA
jgi:hypothetical protein